MTDDTTDQGDVDLDALIGKDDIGAGVSGVDAILESVGDDSLPGEDLDATDPSVTLTPNLLGKRSANIMRRSVP